VDTEHPSEKEEKSTGLKTGHYKWGLLFQQAQA